MTAHPWHVVEVPEPIEEGFPALIEIAKGSKNKYEGLDHEVIAISLLDPACSQ